MTIRISRELPLFNFERLDILCPRIEHTCEKLWPFDFPESFRCSISSVSIYYVPESNIRLKYYDHSNLSWASVAQFRASRYIMSLYPSPPYVDPSLHILPFFTSSFVIVNPLIHFPLIYPLLWLVDQPYSTTSPTRKKIPSLLKKTFKHVRKFVLLKGIEKGKVGHAKKDDKCWFDGKFHNIMEIMCVREGCSICIISFWWVRTRDLWMDKREGFIVWAVTICTLSASSALSTQPNNYSCINGVCV